jgi:hypothetical protein
MDINTVDLQTPRGLALVAGVVLALVAIFLHFSPFPHGANTAFWLMALAYSVSSLFSVVKT